jgi:hypothetical protein
MYVDEVTILSVRVVCLRVFVSQEQISLLNEKFEKIMEYFC